MTALEQNASNTTKQPLREKLESVQKVLTSIRLEELTNEQRELLKRLETGYLLGESGWLFIEKTVKDGNYDPASAATDSRNIINRIENTIRLLENATSSLSNISVNFEPNIDRYRQVKIRVRFKDAAAIDNISLLKKWSSEWYDIIRGIALIADEKPEDVAVLGTSNGSIIVVLGVSFTIAAGVAAIMHQVAKTLQSGLEIANSMEDFRMKRIMNKEIQDALAHRKAEIEKGGVDEALRIVKEKFGDRVSGEIENAVRMSIDKFFDFTEKGGEVDMIPPPNPKDGSSEELLGLVETISEGIEETRAIRSSIQLMIEKGGEQ